MEDGKGTSKSQASRIAIFSAFFLSFFKFLIGYFFSSLVVMASALDNLVDVFMSSLNYFSIKKASQPPDASHPYGHEKLENLAALAQGFFLLFSLFFLFYLSLQKIINRQGEIKDPLTGALTMLLSLLVTFFLSRFLRKKSEETASVALKADALHYTTDLYTNLAALTALVLVMVTGFKILDPLFALLIVVYLILEPLKLIYQAVGGLIDKSAGPLLTEELKKIVFSHQPYAVDFHNLRSREAGSKKLVDFHLVICRQLSFEKAHSLVEEVEREVVYKLKEVDVLIHPDPCPGECELTWETCEIEKRKKNGSLKLWEGALKSRLHLE